MPTSCIILDKLRTFALLPFPVCEMEILVLLRGIQGIKDFKVSSAYGNHPQTVTSYSVKQGWQ